MNTTTMPTTMSLDNRSFGKSMAPAVTLILLSPLIGEVMSGATRLSYLFVYVPEVMMWGCGTLLIREVVRRWRGNWTSMLPLGMALSIVEEFIVQQTSLAPLPWLGSAPMYGRLWGVTWPYFLFMLAFESVSITLIPIQITELIFPERRKEPWLRTAGLVITSAIFVVGAVIAWFLWVRIARIKVFHMPDYKPPLATWLAGWLAIAALVLISYVLSKRSDSVAVATRKAHSPWMVLFTTLVLGFPWYLLMALVFAPQSRPLPLWIPVAATIAWAVLTIFLLRRWASASGWREIHEWALSFGVLLVVMIAGYLGSSLWLKMDVIFKAVLNVLALAGMLLLAVRIRQRVTAYERRDQM